MNFIALPHSSYSPDLAPSDFYLFLKLKEHLRGNHYESDEDVEAAFDIGKNVWTFSQTACVNLTKDKKQHADLSPAKANCSVGLRTNERQLETPFQGQPGTSSMAPSLLLPPQSSPGAATVPRLVFNPSRYQYQQLGQLSLLRPAYTARGLAPSLNTAYAAQASNYLALLQRIL
ncbi:histone-lysine N-methyltransferase SETMAR [Elysia marginata]|uniref:Histone-lysine N-methyltransferase SETMAR n=1 Tax=Elysia marginata TaxID=1093978 RepID=A0AAV4H1S2_9GAST|nr:histone-lysine N-methyltransferase SETMAR [Elysia marginata]